MAIPIAGSTTATIKTIHPNSILIDQLGASIVISRTVFVKGLNYMSGGLKVSCPHIASMIPFINISKFFK